MRGARLACLFALTGGVAAESAAQCSDGSPPPCRSARAASATRRPDPPLDDKTWIVVPFNNVTRAPDVDYLRDASVNLLYLDMSRWQDIRVVDDTRVLDLLKEVPEARTMPLSLEAATAVARRAGAGRMVMGNIIKQGNRTTLAAKVFDVRRGSVLRSPQQDLIVQDSLMSVFSKLAGAILDVPPPSGSTIVGAGTMRVDAYQEYLAGSVALKGNQLTEARTHLTAALRLDSNFALAHYKMAILIGWQAPNDRAKVTHAAAANRLSGSLPPRERTLMKGLNEFEQVKNHDACLTYGSLVRADSNDIDALYGVGECSFHDVGVVPSIVDTSKRVFRGGFNTAIRMFERVLELDPTYHLAYLHIMDALTPGSRAGVDYGRCPLGFQSQADVTRCSMTAALIRSGDSLLLSPVYQSDTTAIRLQAEEYVRTNSRRLNLERARNRAREWVDAAPNDGRARLRLAVGHWYLGALAEADQQLALVKGDLTASDLSIFFSGRFEVAMKLGRSADARRFVDSIEGTPNRTAAGHRLLKLTLGRAADFDSALRASIMRSNRPPPPLVLDYLMATSRVAMAGGNARIDSVERRFADTAVSMTGFTPRVASTFPMYLFAPGRARTWLAMDPAPGDHRGAAIAALSKGDTARFRVAVLVADSAWRSKPVASPDSGAGVILAELYLVLRDSAAALRTVRRTLDTTYVATPLANALIAPVAAPHLVLWPRLALLRADLEAATGNSRAARTWYSRFLDLWATADPEFQPIVERARKSLAALGTP